MLHYLKKRKQIKEWGLKLYNEVEYKDEEQKFIISLKAIIQVEVIS